MTKSTKHGKNEPKKRLVKSAGSKSLSSDGVSAINWLNGGSVVFLLVSVIIFLVTRFRLLAIPLERDEGSFAYIGHWLLRGRELYTDMLDSKLPGLYSLYAVFTTLFGYNATGIHIGLFLANIVSGLCFYFLLKERFSKYVAGLATSFFLLLVISQNVGGFATHATQLLTPFILGGCWLFWRGVSSGRRIFFLLAGLCIGIAFTIKQQAAIYGFLLALMWWPVRLKWYRKENEKLPLSEWLLLGIGGVLPVVLVVGYFLVVGRFDQFYDWTVTQPFHLAGSFGEPRYKLLLKIIPDIVEQFEGIYLLAIAGFVFLFFSAYKKGSSWFGFVFALLGMISVVIGTGYYKHYFVLAIPGVALLAAVALDWVSSRTGRYGPAYGVVIAFGLMILGMKGRSDYYFNPDYAKIHFEMYERNMFPEIEKIGRELAKRVQDGDRIGVMGSEPEVLVAAGRESCSRHLMVYSILSDPELSPPLQQEYIHELQDCAPEYIVWNTITSSWAPGYDQLRFFNQLMEWVELNYKVVALAESRDDKPGVIVWDEGLDTHHSISNFKVFVLKKKGPEDTPVPAQ